MDAIPMATPPIILKTTINVMDSGSILGKPDPQAEIAKSMAAIISDVFLPIALLKSPEKRAPTRAPNKALLTINPFKAPVNSKYLEKKNCVPLITPVS